MVIVSKKAPLYILLSLLSCKNEQAKIPAQKRILSHVEANKNHIEADKNKVYKNTDSIKIVQTNISYTDSIPERLPLFFELHIYQGDKIIQTLSYKYKWSDDFLPNDTINSSLKYWDVNFDGNKDILIYLGEYGIQGVEYYDCFLWNIIVRNTYISRNSGKLKIQCYLPPINTYIQAYE